MKIGFFLFRKDTLNNKDTGVWGDDIVCSTYCKELNKLGFDAKTYTVQDFDKGEEPVDIMIHTTFIITYSKSFKRFGKKSILWIQGFNHENSKKMYDLDFVYDSMKPYYDKIITASRVLAEMKNIPFIIPGVDREVYYPKPEAVPKWDVSCIGNIIKDYSTTYNYIHPLGEFNYGLFGGDFGKINHDKWLDVVSSSKINLHFSFPDCAKWDMVMGTPFFVSASKGFYMCEETPTLKKYYSDSFAFTKGGDEEKEKIRYYLEHDNERRAMIEKAYNTTMANFRSDIMINELINILN